MLIQIAVVKQTPRISDDEVHTAIWACNTQITEHFCLAWNFSPTLVTYYERAEDVPDAPGYAVFLLVERATDGIGWHTETDDDRVYAEIGVGNVIDDEGGVMLLDPANPSRLSVSAVLSHEVLETIADQFINLWCDGPDGETQWAYEVCDPVEADQYPIAVEGVGTAAVSNFVWPGWFDLRASGKVDQMGTAPGPFELAPNGYAVVRRPGKGTSEIFGEKRHRAARFRSLWRASGGLAVGSIE